MDYRLKDFKVPTPKLGTVIVHTKDDYPSFGGAAIEQLVKYARKQEFDYVYKNNEVSGKVILLEMVQQGTMKLSQYMSILPCLDDLTANVEITLI